MASIELLKHLLKVIKIFPMASNPFLVSLLFLSLFFLFVYSKYFPAASRLNLPPSPPKFPIIGNLHQLGSEPHRSLRALSEKYGPLMLLSFGQVPTLIVSSRDMLREIFKKHDIAFSGRPKTTATDVLLYGNKDLGFAPYGEYWRRLRKICNVDLLSHRRVQQFHSEMEEEAVELVYRIGRACVTSAGCAINLSEMLAVTTNNMLSRSVLGKKFVDEDGRRKFGEVWRTMMAQLVEFSVGDLFPSLRWIDVVRGFTGQLKKSFREADKFLDSIIEERKAIIESNGGRSEMKDFVDILIQLQDDSMLDFQFTQDNIKAILLDMFLGGTTTTSNTVEWLMAELMRNPRVLKKAQDEVRIVVGNESRIDIIGHINKMSYVKCVIKETLRLHVPAPLLPPRETTEHINLEGYDIPANTRVLINAWAIQMDQNLWDRPEEFIPERFENNSIDFQGDNFEFVPFGVGRRMCPGLKFGISSVEFMTANLLYSFDWKLPGDIEDLDMSEISALTVQKKFPLYLIPIPYDP